MENPVFLPAEILLPDAQDLSRWAVLACDQYTSQPEYWQAAEELVGDAPSTLRMILPEAFLEEGDLDSRIRATHEKMREYRQNTLTRQVNGFVYVERTLPGGMVRQGLVGKVDLEDYSYEPGAATRIRPSEGTVVERIPSRLAMRRGAVLESPHILMLCDNETASVIEPLARKKESLALLYDTQLMLEGGRVQGWAVTEPSDLEELAAALVRLDDEEAFAKKYGEEPPPFSLIVGDGNHSLAAAKAHWEELKKTLPPAEQVNHPARYCLVELENIHSPAITIEPIHRVLFEVDSACLLRGCALYATAMGVTIRGKNEGEQQFKVVSKTETLEISIDQAPAPLEAGSFEAFIERYREDHPELRVDYVHGEEAVADLAAKGAVGVLLPALQKGDLFRGVALGGVLPKKCFSMGHAYEKRYYLECRAIQP